MSIDVKELFKEALNLPTETRVKLAGELLQSLDEEPAEDVEAAWNDEIHCRLEDGDEAYESTTVESLHRELRGTIKKARAT